MIREIDLKNKHDERALFYVPQIVDSQLVLQWQASPKKQGPNGQSLRYTEKRKTQFSEKCLATKIDVVL